MYPQKADYPGTYALARPYGKVLHRRIEEWVSLCGGCVVRPLDSWDYSDGYTHCLRCDQIAKRVDWSRIGKVRDLR